MRDYRVERSIAAPADKIWGILIDAPLYPEWNPAVQKIDGVIAPGEDLKLTATVDPKRAFKLKVTSFTPPSAMTWTGGMPLGAFTGVRTFTLSQSGDGSTIFVMQEVYSGWMAGMISGRMPDLTDSFEQFAAGLKARAEAE